MAGLEEALQQQEDVAVGDLETHRHPWPETLLLEAAAPPGPSSFLGDASMVVLGTLGADELSRVGAEANRVRMAALGRLVTQELLAGLAAQEEVQS